jgi:hypothetical protein
MEIYKLLKIVEQERFQRLFDRLKIVVSGLNGVLSYDNAVKPESIMSLRTGG